MVNKVGDIVHFRRVPEEWQEGWKDYRYEIEIKGDDDVVARNEDVHRWLKVELDGYYFSFMQQPGGLLWWMIIVQSEAHGSKFFLDNCFAKMEERIDMLEWDIGQRRTAKSS